MIAVAVKAWRWDEQGEALKELQWCERERGRAVGCGAWEAVDDAFGAGVGLAVGARVAGRKHAPVTLFIIRGARRALIAVLSLAVFAENAGMIKLAGSGQLRAGIPVYAYGYPGGVRVARDDGTVRARDANRILLDNIEPRRGSSGGPILASDTDEVVGIVLQRASGEGEQYALEIDLITILLRAQPDFAELFRE